MTKYDLSQIRERVVQSLHRAGIVLSVSEQQEIEVVDFGLGQLLTEGIEIVTYVNTNRYCAKEMVLFPLQTCPEHLHPPVGNEPGKEETFRCRFGSVRLYVDDEPTPAPIAQPPQGSKDFYTAKREILLLPGEQFTIRPGLRHWFRAGPEGAVVSEFSSTSRDEFDIFTDPRIRRESLKD